MATSKQKKKTPQTGPKRFTPPTTAQATAAESMVSAHSIDDEPKVSFTLEFYALDNQESSFIARVKKIGSEEHVILIEDLENQALLDFIFQNLPKSWQKKQTRPALEIGSAPADSPDEATIEGENRTEKASSFELVSEKKFQEGRLEVRQNGQKNTVLDSVQVFELCFEADTPLQWVQYQINFKSWESDVPSYRISQQKSTMGPICVEMVPGNLQAGFYLLEFSATAQKADRTPIIFSAIQLIQLI